MPSRNLSVLAAITVAMIAICWFVVADRYSKSAQKMTQEERLIFPQFQNQLPDITDIEVTRANNKFVLSRSESAWANMGIGGFPTILGRVESALIAMAGMKYIAPKTKRSKLYHRLHVENVTSTSRSTRLAFKDGAGAVVADVIIGKPKSALRQGGYVRLPGNAQSWLAEGVFDVRHGMIEWSDPVVANLDARFMKALTVSHASRGTVALYRDQPQDRKMRLRNLPAGAAVEHQYQIDYMAGLLQELNFTDANRSDEEKSKEAPAFKVSAHWKSQLVVTLHADEPMPDGTVWARIEAQVNDNSQASEFERQEAARIQSKFDGWLVKLPRKFADRLKIRLDDIIQPGEAYQ